MKKLKFLILLIIGMTMISMSCCKKDDPTPENKTYTVSFESNGGSLVASKIVDANSLVTEPTAPTKTNYNFSGWFKEASCTNQWNFVIDRVNSDITLYAKWTSIAITYTVTFNSQGGSAVSSITGIAYNSTINAPTPPTKTDYTFNGWFKEAACTNQWNFASNKVTSNLTLYAKWTVNTTPSYTVTFSVNNGGGTLKAYKNGSDEFESESKISSGTSISFIATPNMAFRVKQWTDGNLNIINNNSDTLTFSLTQDTTVYVEFEQYLHIGDDFQGGKIFCIDSDNQKILICASEDIKVNEGLGDLYQFNWSFAKDTCDNMTLNEYTDWRLPDRSELSKLDNANTSSTIYNLNTNIGVEYWSSEESDNNAYTYNFIDNETNARSKDNEYNVRAVRTATF